MGQMMQDMDQDMRGMRSMMSVNMGGGGTGSRQSISMSMGGGGGGSYSCQTFVRMHIYVLFVSHGVCSSLGKAHLVQPLESHSVSSTRVGPDGRQHQETYSSSSHGGNNSGNRVGVMFAAPCRWQTEYRTDDVAVKSRARVCSEAPWCR